jgi:hypothetical protein
VTDDTDPTALSRSRNIARHLNSDEWHSGTWMSGDDGFQIWRLLHCAVVCCVVRLGLSRWLEGFW